MSRRLSILIYHRVLPEPDPLLPGVIHAALFERHLRWLRRVFHILPLSQAVTCLRSGDLPHRALSITFDDGYADNAEVALPLLQRQGLTATFFVASGFLDGGRMWNDTVIEVIRRWPGRGIDIPGTSLPTLPTATLSDRRAAISRALSALKYLVPAERQAACDELARKAATALPSPMMRSDQVRELSQAGMTIGAHTRTHPILARLSAEQASAEIRDSRNELEALTGAPIRLFAYPNGKPDTDYTAEHVKMLRGMGFDAAVSTAPGAATAATDLFQLPRFTPWDASIPRYLARLLYVRNRTTPAMARSMPRCAEASAALSIPGGYTEDNPE